MEINANPLPWLVAVLPLSAEVGRDLLAYIAACESKGADAIELRLDHPDFLSESAEDRLSILPKIVDASTLPLIGTLRRKQDGGWAGDDLDPTPFFEALEQSGVPVVDLELDNPWTPSDGSALRIIRSYHNLELTDRDRLEEACQTASQSPGTWVVKLASTAKSLQDSLVIKELLQAAHEHPVAALTMGPQGLPSRYLWRQWGSALSYAAAPGCENLLPHLPRLRDMAALSKAQSPRVFGVIGELASESLSPLIHNALSQEFGDQAIYMPVQTADFASAIEFARQIPLAGASVTIPHKHSAWEAAGVRSALAQDVGVANTLTREPGCWRADNTDLSGFLSDLGTHLDLLSLKGQCGLILGYGGAARAVAVALSQQGMKLWIHGRSTEKASAFATEFGASVLGDSDKPVFQLVVNATPLGTPGSAFESDRPIDLQSLTFNEGAMVYDLIYQDTPLLQQAAAMKLPSANGAGMLVYQAIEQRRIWGLSTPDTSSVELIAGALQAGLPFRSRVALIGYRGAGKSTLAQLLSSQLGWALSSTDGIAEEIAGMSVNDVFEKHGESTWRDFELQALTKALASSGPSIIDCGGGIVESAQARSLFSERTIVIYLQADEEKLLSRVATRDDPRLEASVSHSQEIRQRLERRIPLYRGLADLTLDANLSIEAIAEELLRTMRISTPK